MADPKHLGMMGGVEPAEDRTTHRIAAALEKLAELSAQNVANQVRMIAATEKAAAASDTVARLLTEAKREASNGQS